VQNSTEISVGQFYAQFKSLYGLIAAVFGLLPPASGVFLPGLIFPPLGNETALAQFFAVIFGVAVTYLAFWMKNDAEGRLRHRMKLFFVSAIVLFCVYFGLHLRFVQRIDIPSAGEHAFVSIGYERSQFALASFDGVSDSEILHSRGFTEEEIKNLWTPKSLCFSRLALLLSFVGSMLSMVVFASLGVLLRTRELKAAADRPVSLQPE
jgi:hypothetical protein